jgi:hypothetical protein
VSECAALGRISRKLLRVREVTNRCTNGIDRLFFRPEKPMSQQDKTRGVLDAVGRGSPTKSSCFIRASPHSASRLLAQKVLAIFCGAGSAHPPEDPRKMLLRFEPACHGDIQDTRVLIMQHLLCTFYSKA